MPEDMQLFDYQEMWNAVEPLAIPVIIWFVFAVIVAIFIAALKNGPIKKFVGALAMIILPVSLIYFILVGLGAI